MRWWPLIVGGLFVAVIGTGLLVLSPSHKTLADVAQQAVPSRSEPTLTSQPTLTADPPPIYAGSAAVLDAESGVFLFEKNGDQPVPIASTTKVMSTSVFLATKPNLDQEVVVSPEAASQTGSLMMLGAGERITLKGLLSGALLVSGNDAIYAIAQQHAGGVNGFVAAMNDTAQQLGLKDSRFLDPAGLDDAGRSSAHDLALMFRYALTFNDFRSIVSQPEIGVTSSTDHYQLKNSDRLVVGSEPLFLGDAIGGKTGFTPDAGHCLVAAARRNGHVLIAVVLASDDTAADGSAREARRLLTWAFDHTSWR